MRRFLCVMAGIVAAAAPSLLSAQETTAVEYRDNSEAVDLPIADVPALIPMGFVDGKDHFDVVSYKANATKRKRYKASRFLIDEEKFEILAGQSSLVISDKPWQPARDGLKETKTFIPQLGRCNYARIDSFGCNIYPGRNGLTVVRAKSLFAGNMAWELTIKVDKFIAANSIEMPIEASVKISDGEWSQTKDYTLQPGMMFPVRPTVMWSTSSADPILKRLGSGRDLTVSFLDKDNKEHSFVVPARDFRIGFMILQRVWPELRAVNDARKEASKTER